MPDDDRRAFLEGLHRLHPESPGNPERTHELSDTRRQELVDAVSTWRDHRWASEYHRDSERHHQKCAEAAERNARTVSGEIARRGPPKGERWVVPFDDKQGVLIHNNEGSVILSTVTMVGGDVAEDNDA